LATTSAAGRDLVQVQGPNVQDPAAQIIELRRRAQQLIDQDRFAEAAELMLQAKNLAEKELRHFGMMAKDASERAQWPAAISATNRALSLIERLEGPTSPAVIVFLSNLTFFYTAEGDFVRADAAVQRLLPLIQPFITATPPNDPGLAIIFHNIGAAFRARGEYARAEPFYRALLRIRERDPQSAAFVEALNAMAGFLMSKQENKEAEALLRRALAILEEKKPLMASLRKLDATSVKPFDLALAHVLNSLAVLQHANGDINAAAESYQSAIKLIETSLGADSITSAAARQNLALVRKDQKKYQEAEELYLGARATIERMLGPSHLETAKIFGNLAMLYMAEEKVDKALAALKSNVEISELNLNLILSVGSESQRQSYVNALAGYVDSVISFHTRLAPDNQEARSLALTTILRRKGRLLDAMAEMFVRLRNRARADDIAKFDQLISLRTQLAGFFLEGRNSGDPESFAKKINALDDKVQKLESELGQNYAELRLATTPTTIGEIQLAIPENQVLVEIVSYRPVNPKTSGFAGDQHWGPPRYVAYILRRQGEPDWVELPTAGAVIDDSARELRALIRSEAPPADVGRVAKRVFQQVFEPIAKKLGDKQDILISPDGALNLIPFAALIDANDHFAVEKYSFTYVTSGRDLLRLRNHLPSRQGPVIIADPEFEPAADENTQPENSNDAPTPLSKDLHQSFDPLEATADEAKEIAGQLKDSVVFAGPKATEKTVKSVSGPSILHLATHGFFLADQKGTTAGTQLKLDENSPLEFVHTITESALLRSGLALSGANKFLGGNGDDGILTAFEVAGLDLRGTQLVVLSACETGLGNIQNGEGVYGLRRAFLLAGAESELVSLWKVNSEATRELMGRYYSRLACGDGRSQALRTVQLEMLKLSGRKHPYYWAGFLPVGESKRLSNVSFQPGTNCSP